MDPPPVLSLSVYDRNNQVITHDIKSIFILHTSLIDLFGDKNKLHNSSSTKNLNPQGIIGSTLVSLTHIRSPLGNKFLFLVQDISIRLEGHYKLLFNVYEVKSQHRVVLHRARAISNTFTVYSPKCFPGLNTSSDLIKEIALQGCKVRVRKKTKLQKKKLKPSPDRNLVKLPNSDYESHSDGGSSSNRQRDYLRYPIEKSNCFNAADFVTNKRSLWFSDLENTSYEWLGDTGIHSMNSENSTPWQYIPRQRSPTQKQQSHLVQQGPQPRTIQQNLNFSYQSFELAGSQVQPHEGLTPTPYDYYHSFSPSSSCQISLPTITSVPGSYKYQYLPVPYLGHFHSPKPRYNDQKFLELSDSSYQVVQSSDVFQNNVLDEFSLPDQGQIMQNMKSVKYISNDQQGAEGNKRSLQFFDRA